MLMATSQVWALAMTSREQIGALDEALAEKKKYTPYQICRMKTKRIRAPRESRKAWKGRVKKCATQLKKDELKEEKEKE